MHFTKMQGLGNDYVFLDCTQSEPENLNELARRLSDRHFGVGSDGLICVFPSERGGDFKMRMFNADGSEGEMCGNGIRCLGKFVYDQGLTDRTEISVETPAGIRNLQLHLEKGKVSEVTVDMGRPEIAPAIQITVDQETYTAVPVSMGNPHCVVEVEDPQKMQLEVIGPAFECWPYFPDRTNAEFVRVLAPGELELRVWERGSGETLACGTGACAALAALVSQRKCRREAVLHLPGGDLKVRWEEKNGHMSMTGPAVKVFDGKLAD